MTFRIVGNEQRELLRACRYLVLGVDERDIVCGERTTGRGELGVERPRKLEILHSLNDRLVLLAPPAGHGGKSNAVCHREPSSGEIWIYLTPGTE